MDTATETKINNNLKAEMNVVLRKKPFTIKKRVLLFFVKFLVSNQFARAKISVEWEYARVWQGKKYQQTAAIPIIMFKIYWGWLINYAL